jgi:hypothetical protein
MSEDTGGETIDWSSAIASDRDAALEPEIIRWLKMYVDVADGRADATVGAILDEVNQLLRRYRASDEARRAGVESRPRVPSESTPDILRTPATTTPQARRGLERRLQLRAELHEINAYLEEALTASARDDWASALEAVRMIQGRTVLTRRSLEALLGLDTAADAPPLVLAIRAVRGVISDQEVDSLAPDELRARLHAVLRALDRELQAFLSPPEDASIPADDDHDEFSGAAVGPERS